MVADAFSSLLNKSNSEGTLHGARASRQGPTIFHLLFTDDSLLFARAKSQECTKIVKIHKLYEAASSQKINYDKSESALLGKTPFGHFKYEFGG